MTNKKYKVTATRVQVYEVEVYAAGPETAADKAVGVIEQKLVGPELELYPQTINIEEVNQ